MGKDCGIDLVYEDKQGKHWAVQSKCISPDREISKAEIDSFLSESNDPRIYGRLLVASTDGIGKNALQVIERQEKQVVCFLREHFCQSEVEFPRSPADLSTGRRKERRTPRPHQEEAIRNVVSGLKTADRGQLLMACGTGKTLTSLWIKEALNAKRTLVLLPSLSLLSQTLREWTAASQNEFNWICVCSDKSVAKQDKTIDDWIENANELGAPVTGDPTEIAEFLLTNKEVVVFSTYQSSPLVAEAQGSLDVPTFDITFADEAHRCAGKVSPAFSSVLDSKKIRSVKRLFMTATPKVLSPFTKSIADKNEIEVASMDDRELFGIVLHKLSFGEAIARDLLTDYRIIIVGVDNTMIERQIRRNDIVSVTNDLSIDAESLAAHIALNKTIDEYSIGRAITFHSKVSDAKKFANTHNIIAGCRQDAGGNNARKIESTYVSGKMSAYERNAVLNKLRQVNTTNTTGIVCNARCLGEGVDVPSLDGIAFITPKKSHVDIIQAVGRAIRKSEDKTLGTILIPVFIGNEDLISDEIEIKGYQKIWDVLTALKSHDDELASEMDDIAVKAAKNAVSYTNQITLPAKIIFDLPKTCLRDFENALKLQILRNTCDPWLTMYGRLLRYRATTGNPYPKQTEVLEDGTQLGYWVARQRRFRDSMSKKRFDLLNRLEGWEWDVLEARWEQGLNEIKEFAKNHGHACPPNNYTSKHGFKLGAWVANIRQKRSEIPEERQRTLELLPGWNWKPSEDRWDKAYQRLVEHVNRTGTALVDGSFKCDDGFSLGSWVKNQRTKRSNGTLSDEELQKLERLPNWTWHVLESTWERNYALLAEYLSANKNKYPNYTFKTNDGIMLGNWVVSQRGFFSKMDPDRIRMFEELPGWTWDKKEAMWNEGFDYLLEYRNTTGKPFPPLKYRAPDNYNLGGWVQTQRDRYNKETLSIERQARLSSLNGWIWNVMEEEWKDAFNKLSEYISVHQRRPPNKYTCEDGFPLGTWTNNQVSLWRKGRQTTDRISLFESLQNWSWTYGKDNFKDRWEVGYKELVNYLSVHGHARPPQKYIANSGFRLGTWVTSQRDPRKSLSEYQKELLENLPGWCWSVKDAQWLEAYDELKDFLTDKNEFVVPKLFRSKTGFGLGAWVYRQQNEKGKLDEWKISKLEALPLWQWNMPNLYEHRWMVTFLILKDFSDMHGHCDVPDELLNEQGLPLIRWIKQQKTRRYVDNERESLLESLSGWTW